MAPFGIFATKDVENIYPSFNRRRLNEWQDKKYITKIRNSWYCFPEVLENIHLEMLIANLIHSPSYISLETALSWYQIVPEGTSCITSITTNRPVNYKTELGECFYKVY